MTRLARLQGVAGRTSFVEMIIRESEVARSRVQPNYLRGFHTL